MSESLSLETLDALDDLQVVIDGERLFTTGHNTPTQQLICTIICNGTRLAGTLLLVLAALMIAWEQVLDAFYVGLFGLTLLLGALIGLRQFQNDPRRLVLDAERLSFLDSWNNIYREFPRSACLEVLCECAGEHCDLRVLHPNHTVNVVIEGLPRVIGQQIANRLNQRLRAAGGEHVIPAAPPRKAVVI